MVKLGYIVAACLLTAGLFDLAWLFYIFKMMPYPLGDAETDIVTANAERASLMIIAGVVVGLLAKIAGQRG